MSFSKSNQVMPEGEGEGAPAEEGGPPPIEISAGGSDGFIADEKENPCRCCCPLLKAAKIVGVLNIIFVVVTLINEFKSLASISPSEKAAIKATAALTSGTGLGSTGNSGVDALFDFGKQMAAFPLCLAGGGIATGIQVCILLHLVAALTFTVLFLLFVVFRPSEVKRRILFCNIFMWYNFICLGFWLYVILVAINHLDYSGVCEPLLLGCISCFTNMFVWIVLVFQFIVNVPWGISVARMAKAYRNAVKRGSGMMGQEIAIQQPTTTTTRTSLTKMPDE